VYGRLSRSQQSASFCASSPAEPRRTQPSPADDACRECQRRSALRARLGHGRTERVADGGRLALLTVAPAGIQGSATLQTASGRACRQIQRHVATGLVDGGEHLASTLQLRDRPRATRLRDGAWHSSSLSGPAGCQVSRIAPAWQRADPASQQARQEATVSEPFAAGASHGPICRTKRDEQRPGCRATPDFNVSKRKQRNVGSITFALACSTQIDATPARAPPLEEDQAALEGESGVNWGA